MIRFVARALAALGELLLDGAVGLRELEARGRGAPAPHPWTDEQRRAHLEECHRIYLADRAKMGQPR